MQKGQKGFTLVELSIVLVIIGLLIGGILVAQSMVGTTRIQAQIRQLQKFDIALTNFYNNYKQIPGDSAMFGMAPSATTQDGYINDNLSSPTVPPQYLWSQPFYVFIELYNSGMISSAYSFNGGLAQYGLGKSFPSADIGKNRAGIALTSSMDYNLWYTFWSGTDDTNELGHP